MLLLRKYRLLTRELDHLEDKICRRPAISHRWQITVHICIDYPLTLKPLVFKSVVFLFIMYFMSLYNLLPKSLGLLFKTFCICISFYNEKWKKKIELFIYQQQEIKRLSFVSQMFLATSLLHCFTNFLTCTYISK